MAVSSTESSPLNEMAEESSMKTLKEIENQIHVLQDAAKSARRRCAAISRQCSLIWGQLSYLFVARFLRETISSIIGWRWAVVLIGATIVGALFVVLSLSWTAGFYGVLVGGTFFASLVYLPKDSRLVEIIPALKDSVAKLGETRIREHNNLLQITREIAAASESQRQIINQLEQYRQSKAYRLQKLASKNWKAMRGGELEAFLEEVFSELHYSVDRTGKSGDQGVDLIVGRDGYRIAVQVKGYLDSVPNTAIQEAHTGMEYYKCNASAVITNSRFTQAGQNIAKAVSCVLIDENKMPMLITGQIDLLQEVCTLTK